MSFILDALKRADRERRQESLEEVGFDAPPEPPPAPIRPSPDPRILGGLALVGLVLVAVVVFQLMGNGRPEPETAPAQRAAEPSTAPVTPPGPRQLGSTPEPQSPPEPRPPAEPPTDSSHDPEVEDLYATTTGSGDSEAVEQLYTQPEPRPQYPKRSIDQPVAESVTRLPEPTQPAVGEAEPSRLARELRKPSTPHIRDLPSNLQQQVPSINYNEHRYEDGNNNSVVLNGRELRAGGQLSTDLKVEEIHPDGVVLSFQGHKFKLQAQSSWVNM